MTTKEKFKENEDYGNRVSDSNLNLNNECKVSIPIYCHPKSSAHKKNDTMESDGNCQGVKLQKMLKLRSNDLKRTISDAAMRLNDTFSFANNSNVDHHIVVYENFFYRTDYEKMEKQKHETNQQSQYKIDFCKQQADGPMKKTTMGFKANIKMLNPTKPTSLQPQFIIAPLPKPIESKPVEAPEPKATSATTTNAFSKPIESKPVEAKKSKIELRMLEDQVNHSGLSLERKKQILFSSDDSDDEEEEDDSEEDIY